MPSSGPSVKIVSMQYQVWMPSQWAYRASMRVLGRVLCMHAWGGRKRKQSNRIDKGAWSGLRRRRWHQHAHSCQGTWSDGKLEVRCCSLRFCVVSFRPGCFEQYGALSEFEPEAGITLHDPDLRRQIQVYQNLDSLKVFTQWLVLLSLRSSMTRSCHAEKRNKLGKKSTEFIENIPQPRKWCSVEGSCGIGKESSDFDHAFLDLKPLCLYGSESCKVMPQTDGSLLSFCHLFSANLTRETSSASRTVELSQCCCTWSMSERCWLLSFAAWGRDWANAWKMML